MTGRKKVQDHIHQPRRDRMDEERVSGPYRARGKWPEPTTCPDCGAVFHHGHWQWGAATPGAAQHVCPACQRVRDRVPAGELSLSGKFFIEHRDEIMHLVRNTETKARAVRSVMLTLPAVVSSAITPPIDRAPSFAASARRSQPTT